VIRGILKAPAYDIDAQLAAKLPDKRKAQSSWGTSVVGASEFLERPSHAGITLALLPTQVMASSHCEHASGQRSTDIPNKPGAAGKPRHQDRVSRLQPH
jgi:hypothetical protein